MSTSTSAPPGPARPPLASLWPLFMSKAEAAGAAVQMVPGEAAAAELLLTGGGVAPALAAAPDAPASAVTGTEPEAGTPAGGVPEGATAAATGGGGTAAAEGAGQAAAPAGAGPATAAEAEAGASGTRAREAPAGTRALAVRFPQLAARLVQAPVPPSSAPSVVTAAAFAVAETGSVAVIEERADRGACFLAERLWVLVPAAELEPTLDTALQRVARLARAGTPYVTLMTGPSRTADIERVLTTGVHGPREVTIVVVGCGEAAEAGERAPAGGAAASRATGGEAASSAAGSTAAGSTAAGGTAAVGAQP